MEAAPWLLVSAPDAFCELYAGSSSSQRPEQQQHPKRSGRGKPCGVAQSCSYLQKPKPGQSESVGITYATAHRNQGAGAARCLHFSSPSLFDPRDVNSLKVEERRVRQKGFLPQMTLHQMRSCFRGHRKNLHLEKTTAEGAVSLADALFLPPLISDAKTPQYLSMPPCS